MVSTFGKYPGLENGIYTLINSSNVMHVINFDLPSAEHDGRSEYVHRIGKSQRNTI